MNSAGIKQTVAVLETLQAKTDRALSFLKIGLTEDRLQHVQELQFMTKGSVNNIFRSGTGIRHYPCITKIFALMPNAKGEFPKEVRRDPLTCAQILYVLYNNYPDKAMLQDIETKALQCRAQCDICYKLAFEEFYRHGILTCKK